MSWEERWKGSDQGLIMCWERGRLLRAEDPDVAARAAAGELVELGWKGSTFRLEPPDGPHAPRPPKRVGVLHYLAMWQGVRGEDLDVSLEGGQTLTCSRTGHEVIFVPVAQLPDLEDDASFLAAGIGPR